MTRKVTNLPVTEKSVANGNWDTSRTVVDRVIIHTMCGTATSADARFNNSTSQVSAHYGILLDGSIWHWVDEDNTAYHAGNYAMNQRSIGIEHEDGGDYNGIRPEALYVTSGKLVRDICLFYNIPIDRTHILKHSEIIATGCPDALDIERIVRSANGIVAPPIAIPNPGYAPTFEGQDVSVNGTHYKSYKDTNGVLLWKIEAPSTPTPPPAPPVTPNPAPPPVSTPPVVVPQPTPPVATPPVQTLYSPSMALSDIDVIVNHSSWLAYLSGRGMMRNILKKVGR